MYALAAGAAGVSALALTQPAEAKIIYTPTWIEIVPKSGPVNLDLNNDGVADFRLGHHQYSTSRHYISILEVLPQNQGNAVWGTANSASALGAGVSIGSQGKFQSGHESMARFSEGGGSSTGSKGQWKEATRNYLGVKFTIQGETHFGWIRMNVTVTSQGAYAAVTGYAFETLPNTPIVTGQTQGGMKKRGRNQTNTAFVKPPGSDPGSLGLLAYGAPGLSVWRKRDPTPK
jgi:hypothetical protein